MAYFFAFKDKGALAKDHSGYAHFWNEYHVSAVRFNRGSTGARSSMVSSLWKVKPQSTKFSKKFQEKGGAERERKRIKKDLETFLSSGRNGGRGAFFEAHRKALEKKLNVARRDIQRLPDPASCSKPCITTLASTQTGADFDVGPPQFHFLDAGKRHAQSSYDP